jgi:uncharacterized protein (UPF0261 family)
MPTVVLVGTLDTKGTEYAYFRDHIRLGRRVLLVDVGILASRPSADISRANRGGRGVDVRRNRGSRHRRSGSRC